MVDTIKAGEIVLKLRASVMKPTDPIVHSCSSSKTFT